MSQRVLLILSVAVLTAGAFAGCFGDDESGVEAIDGSKLPPFETTLFVHPQMFHPHPAGMLSAWVFSESPDPPTSMNLDVPVLRVTEGQLVRITLINTHDMNHTIHWHGMHVPWEMDGVPYVTQDPLEQNDQFTYEFVAKPAGTHWFHCHVDAPHHIDMGMYGVLIVEPAVPEEIPYDDEFTLVLDDWDSRHLHQQGNDPEMTADSMIDPSGDPFNQADRTVSQGREAFNDPQYANQQVYSNPLRESRDWYPETFAPWQPTYDTWTINGRSYPYTVSDPNTLLTIDEGETIKVRLVNVGNQVFSIHLHGHHFKVTHSDGYALPAPITKDTLAIAPGERYDIIIEGDNPGIWMLHDHMGLHAMNNHISPGGIKTHLVYDSFMDEMEDQDDHSGHMKSTSFFGLYR